MMTPKPHHPEPLADTNRALVDQQSIPLRYAASIERKSTADAYGIEQQYRLNCARAAEEGYIIPNEPAFRFTDDDVSGALKDRPGLSRLLAIAESGTAPFTRVYVKDRTRLGRWEDSRRHFHIEILLMDRGIELRYCDEKAIDFADGEEGELYAGMITGVINTMGSSKERRRLIHRVRMSLRDRVLNGFYPGSKAPYGTTRWLVRRDDKNVFVEEAKPDGQSVVRRSDCNYRLAWATDGTKERIAEIYRRFEAGESMRKIAACFNDAGVPSPGTVQAPHGYHPRPVGTKARSKAAPTGVWSEKSVRWILAHPICVGDLYWGVGGKFTRQDAVPASDAKADSKIPIYLRDYLADAPIARVQWDAVPRRLGLVGSQTRAMRAGKPDYPLGGLLRCTCGEAFYGFTSTKKEAKRRRYYRHNLRRVSQVATCPHANRYISAEFIERPVHNAAMVLLSGKVLRDLATTALADHARDDSSQQRMQLLERRQADLDEARRASGNAAVLVARAKTEAEREIYANAVEKLARELLSAQQAVRELQAESEGRQQLQERMDRSGARDVQLGTEYRTGSLVTRKAVLRALFESLQLDFLTDEVDLRVRAC